MAAKNIICFGEILWDKLPSGKKPGGAPMNVAYHLQQLGNSSRIVSRVGQDDLGRALVAFLNDSGIDTSWVQQDDSLPTSTVEVALDQGGTPTYDIVEDVAWDNIQTSPDLLNEVRVADALIFGSLACRTAQSHRALTELLEVAALRIFDINLRPPFYSQPLLEQLLTYADIVKVNEEELGIVAKWTGNYADETEKARVVMDRYGIDLLIVTRGERGALCVDNKGVFAHPIFPITVADTIGSGDAFLAGFVHQYLQEKSTEECLELASAMGAFVATKAGATPTLDSSELKRIRSGDAKL